MTGSPIVLILLIGGLGLIVGSFLNVVILRLPPRLERRWQDEAYDLLGLTRPEVASSGPPGLVVERSCCPNCKAQIRAYDNIPVLSYLFLGGRCRSCRQRISVQYPLVELATALASALCAWRYGFSVQLAASLLLTWTLIALSGIDFRTQLLPDDLTLPLLWCGLLLSVFGIFASPNLSIWGAVVGYLSLWSVYWLFWFLTGKEGMGYGDFKLLGALGAWLGVSAVLPVILLSTVVGAVVGTALLVFLGRDRQMPMPFGPFLAGAGFLYLIFAEQLRAWIPILAL